MEKTTKYLRCHTASYGYSVGDRFAVIDEDSRCYYVKGLDGGYTKLPDESGLSYATWFTLETDGITLLPDESLGGVMREYREVKRKACVGETVIMTEATGVKTECGREVPDYHNGDTFAIDYVSGNLAGSTSGKLFYHREYSVLEPTDILHIDDVRYTMVDRKATVGERVIVTGKKALFDIGEVFVVENDKWAIPAVGLRNGYNVIAGDYAVLEPLNPGEPDASLIDKITDEYAENITVLVRKIAELEGRVETLEGAWSALKGAVNNAAA